MLMRWISHRAKYGLIGMRTIEARPRFDVISLFPEMLEKALAWGIVGRALRRQLVEVGFWNPRDFTSDPHRTVDDRPYGGGPGMVMKYQPLAAAVRAARKVSDKRRSTIYLSPQGRRLDTARLNELALSPGAILVCGRYEGIDERFIEAEVDEELSIGDYVLSGGEPAALVVLDATIRLLPEALGDEDSALQDSFCSGLLDYPHYTRPETIEGRRVPDVLLSGNHQAVRRWRRTQAMMRTSARRRDLWELQRTNEFEVVETTSGNHKR